MDHEINLRMLTVLHYVSKVYSLQLPALALIARFGKVLAFPLTFALTENQLLPLPSIPTSLQLLLRLTA